MDFKYCPKSIFKNRNDYIKKILVDPGMAKKLFPIVFIIVVFTSILFFIAGARNEELFKLTVLLSIVLVSFYFLIQLSFFLKAFWSWDSEIVFEGNQLFFGVKRNKAEKIIHLKDRGDYFFVKIKVYPNYKFLYFVFDNKQQKEEFILKAKEFIQQLKN